MVEPKETAERICVKSFRQRLQWIKQVKNSSEDIFNSFLNEGGLTTVSPSNQNQAIVTTIKNWADGRESSGLIIIGNTIASSVLVKALPQPDSVITNIFMLVINHPPVLLTVSDDDEDESVQDHNLSLATELTDSLLSFTSEQFSILPIVLPISKFVSVDHFSSAIREAVSEQSKFFINKSLRMPRKKLKNLTRSYMILMSTTDVDGTLWILTLENFKKLNAMVDSKEFNTSGGAVLLMEAARRLDRLGPTVLVVWGGKDIYALRAKNICSHVCTMKEMKEPHSTELLNVVTLFERKTISDILVPGFSWCITDELTTDKVQTQLLELRDRTYEEIREGTKWGEQTSVLECVNQLLDEGKKTIALIGDCEDRPMHKTAIYKLLGELQVKGREVYLLHSPTEFGVIRTNDKEGIVMIADVFRNTDMLLDWDSVLHEAFVDVECSTIFLINKARDELTCEFISDEDHFKELLKKSVMSDRAISPLTEKNEDKTFDVNSSVAVGSPLSIALPFQEFTAVDKAINKVILLEKFVLHWSDLPPSIGASSFSHFLSGYGVDSAFNNVIEKGYLDKVDVSQAETSLLEHHFSGTETVDIDSLPSLSDLKRGDHGNIFVLEGNVLSMISGIPMPILDIKFVILRRRKKASFLLWNKDTRTLYIFFTKFHFNNISPVS